MTKLYTSFILVFIASCGGGGGGGNTTPVTPAPLVSIAADPLTVLLTNTSTITWSSTNATSCSASGSWSGSKAISGSEVVTISTTGNNTYALSCTGAGGSGSASVSVEGYRNSDGVVVDGYISGAEVFIDEDDDWIADSNESSTTSDNDGKFTIKYANGNLVSIGGTDLDSQTLLDNLLITHKLTGHSDFKAVTPVTSVAAFMTDAANVNAALGIDTTIDVAIFDPVANKGDGGINDYLYEKGNQLTVLAYALQNITNDLNTTIETTQDYFKAITEEIETEFNETASKVDIETETFITKTLDNVIAAKTLTITDDAKANTTKALSGVMPIIEVKSSNDLTTSVIRFAVSTLQTDIKAIANGTASAETLTSYTTDVLNYIATDQNIDADEITPDISAIADSASASEDTAVDINVLTNDSFITTAPITVTAANGSNGSTAVTSNVITYSPNADFNGTDTFTYSIIQGDKTSSADVSITVEAVNDAPSIDSASTIKVAENQIAVTTISVSDVDEDDLTLTLSGTDADSFNLSTDNVLTFKEVPDFETKSSYSITLSLTDGTETVTKDIIISVTNLNDVAPEFTSNATFSAEENQTAIGTVTASDEEGDEVTFSVSGTELAITSAGILTFKVTPDYETKSSYSAIVTSNDGVNTSTQDITVSVTNINEVPVITGNSEFSLDEDLPKYTVCSGGDLYGSGSCEVFYINATDPEGDNLTYSISGTDKDGFQVNSAGKVSTTFGPNYEQANDADANNIYEFIINVSDSFLSASKNIIVNVINLNDGPYFIGQNSFYNIPENQKSIGTFTGEDPDGDDYTISISGTDAELFNLSSNNALTFKSNPDFETKSSYQGIVAISDGQITANQSFQVTIKNLNDNNPVFTSPTTYGAAENQTAIGTVTATDADGDEITFTVSGSELAITSTGVLTFVAAPDFETKASYTATVTANDGVKDSTQDITVSVTNVNDIAPVISSDATFSAAENQTAIGSVVATDAEGDEITFTVSGSELAITSTGVLTFVAAPDFETKASYTATVTANDGANPVTQDITVTITNVNEAPVYTSPATFSAAENQTAIGSVVATDAEGDEITFTVSGTELAITSAGVLTFVAAPDFETKASYTATVTANDGINSSTQNITINITNLLEDIISTTFTIGNGTNSLAPLFTGKAVIDELTDAKKVYFKIWSTSKNGTLVQSLHRGGLCTDGVIHVAEATKTSSTAWEVSESLSPYMNENCAYGITLAISLSETSIEGSAADRIFLESRNKHLMDNTKQSSMHLFISGTRWYDTPKSDAYAGFITITNSRSDDLIELSSGLRYVLYTSGEGNEDYSSASSISHPGGTSCVLYDASLLYPGLEGKVAIPGCVHAFLNNTISVDGDYYTMSYKILAVERNPSSAYSVIRDTNGMDYSLNIADQYVASYANNEHQLVYGVKDSSNPNILTFTYKNHVKRMAKGGLASPGSIFVYTRVFDKGYNSYYQNYDSQMLPSSTSSSILDDSPPTLNSIIISDSYDADTQRHFALLTADVTNYGSANFTPISDIWIDTIDPNCNRKTFYLRDELDDKLAITTSTFGAKIPVLEQELGTYQIIEMAIADDASNRSTYFKADSLGSGNAAHPKIGSTFTIGTKKTPGTCPILKPSIYRNAGSTLYKIAEGIKEIKDLKTLINSFDSSDTYSYSIDNIFLTGANGSSSGYTDAVLDADGNQINDSDQYATDQVYEITSDGILQYKSIPDYENPPPYQLDNGEIYNTVVINISSTNSGATIVQGLKVVLTDIDDTAPVITSSATLSADENQNGIATLTATDVDTDNSQITFTVSGTELAITSAGVLTFSSAPDYETKTSYTATVTATDGTNSTTQDITVNVTNVNDNSPVFTSSATYSAAENQSAISSVSATDADGDSVTFSVSGTELAITSAGVLTFSSAPDYETKATYTATLTASDGTNSTTQDMTVSVTNVNEAPVISNIQSSLSAEENQLSVYQVNAVDYEGNTIYYSITGTDKSFFDISSSGVITFNIAPDFESPADSGSNNSYSININVSDVQPSLDSNLINLSPKLEQTSNSTEVIVTNVDEDLINLVFSTTDGSSAEVPTMSIDLKIDELTQASEVQVLTWLVNNTQTWHTATKVDSLNWSILKDLNRTLASGTYEIRKVLIKRSGLDDLTIVDTALIEKGFDIDSVIYNTGSDSTDPILSGVDSITVSGNDDNSSTNIVVTIIASVNDGIGEIDKVFSYIKGPGGETVGAWGVLNDAKSKVTFEFNLEPRTGSGTYTIDDIRLYDVAGNQSFYNNSALVSAGFTNSWTITNSIADSSAPNITALNLIPSINASDLNRKRITINLTTDSQVTDINDIYIRIISPDSANIDQYIVDTGRLFTTTQDGNNYSHTISLPLEYPDGIYNISYVFINDKALNNKQYQVAELNSLGFNTNVVFGSGNDHSPDISSSAIFSASENQTSIGTVTANDADGDSITFTVSGSELAITSAGVLTFASAPDYETKSTYTATVTASDGTNTSTQAITVNVTDVNEAPVFTSSATFSAAENQTSIDTVTATDADGDSVTFTVSGSELAITSAGVLTFASAPDYETKSTYTATVTASDGTVSITQDLTVNIADINEAPSFSSSASFSAEENQTAIGSVSVSDQEGESITYSLSGTDAGSLAISSSGVVSFSSAPNYESKNSYSANVNAGDGTNTTTQAVTVSVTDVNDAPVATAAGYYLDLLPQTQSGGNITLAGTDEDGDTLTYSIVSNGSYGTASLSGATAAYQTSASTQSAQSESFTFKVNDGTVDSANAAISIDLRTDPLYKYQWHLNNTGQTSFATNAGTSGQDLNVDSVIVDGYTGNGVKISIVDDGLEIAHEDLVDNIISGSWDFVNSDSDPTQTDSIGGHGTSIGGLIAAKGWNNKGGRGIAPNASIFGYNFLESGFATNHNKSLGVNPPGGVTADIYNMSYGADYPTDSDDEYLSAYDLPSYMTSTYESKFVNGVTNLRGGKGAIYVWSAGNEYAKQSDGDCGYNKVWTCTEISLDNKGGTPYLIQVGALDADGTKTSYSNPGSSLWVSGFGGEGGNNASYSGVSLRGGNKPAMMTVDRSSCSKGYVQSGVTPGDLTKDNFNAFQNGDHSENSSCNYVSTFNGTSSAAPTIAGVVALMLEANSDLTWRDVKHILASTSDKVDSSRTESLGGVSQYAWITNQAGYEFHNWYGFGKVNAAAAVTSAKSYTANSRGTFASTDYQQSGALGISIPDGTARSNAISITKPSGSNDIVEFVRVSLKFDHAAPWNIGVRLQSPDGTVINLMQPLTNINNPGSTLFDIGVSGLYGESIEGDWTLELIDYYNDSVTGTFTGWGIEIWGN